MNRRDLFRGLFGAAVASCVRWLPMAEKPEAVKMLATNYERITIHDVWYKSMYVGFWCGDKFYPSEHLGFIR